MIPRLKPKLGWSELFAALRFPKANDIERFESEFAKTLGARHAIAFPYGRTGLIFLLEALGLKEQEVITPAYTCVVVQHSVMYSKNTPQFVDSSPIDFNMEMEQVRSRISSRTGAIIATSIFGSPCNLDQLEQIAKSAPQIFVIQDCAHSFGAAWKGKPVHKAGIAAIFGLNISKLLCSIFGGMVTTDDSALAERLRKLRDEKLRPPSWKKSLKRLAYLLAVYPTFWSPIYTLINKMERSGLLNRFTRYFDEGKIDMPQDYLEQITSLEARVGIANLQRYQDILSRRQQIARYYIENLKLENFKLPPWIEGSTYSHFVVQVPDRQAWLDSSLTKGLQLGQLIEYSVPEMSAYGSHPPSEFPHASKYARNTINLPIWGDLKMAKKVVQIIKRVHSELEAKNGNKD